MNKKVNILFMGTPLFAVESLKAIHSNENFNICAVVSTIDKPAGRGLKITPSEVTSYAMQNSLKIIQPKNLKSKLFLKQLNEMDLDIIIVVAFKKIPKEVWMIPKLGTFNLHASLLPNYRGAAPINWAIINGEKETGVTTFLINEEIDAGKILLQEKIVINENENATDIYTRLMNIGSKLVVETVEKLVLNEATPISQPRGIEFKMAPKLFPANCTINWELPVNKIHDFIRGLSPYPSAWTSFKINDQLKKVKILKGYYNLVESDQKTPSIEIINKELVVKNSTGIFMISELKVEGKSIILAESFINGCKSLSF